MIDNQWRSEGFLKRGGGGGGQGIDYPSPIGEGSGAAQAPAALKVRKLGEAN